jgi:hypothetical protein
LVDAISGGDPTFYASLHFNTAVLEVLQDEGDYIIVSEWKVKQNHSLSCYVVCHPEITLKNPLWQKAVDDFIHGFLQLPSECSRILTEILKFLAEEFSKSVKENNKDYLISAIISKLILDQGEVDAIMYPGAKEPAGPLNFAIKNDCVHEKLDLLDLHLVRIDEIVYDTTYPEKLIGINYKPFRSIMDTYNLEEDTIDYKIGDHN